MRKIGFTLVLILSLALLSACAHTSQTAVTGTTAATLDAIVQKGELVVGTAASMPPFNMTTKDGEIIGFEPDLARLIAAGLGVP
ncbi:MAG: transporter substrate-binding domain-containing protein, partial [Thermodesulfobacteriota bacterium]|nr:transporter substrate-binding domain-containing protein [Thermodesulfobacteriota bacterium]